MNIVVRGCAIATSLGDDPAELLDDLLEGKVGIGPFEHPDAAGFRTQRAYVVPLGDDSPGPFEPGRASALVTRLILRALEDAEVSDLSDKRVAVVVSSSQRELASVELWATGRGPAVQADQLSFRRAVSDAIGGARFLSVVAACAAGLVGTAVGSDLLEDDEADLVIVVSVDSLHSTVGAMYDRVATRIATEIRAFDEDRVGTIFGEGGAAIVLERGSGRGTVVLRGVGSSSDANRSPAPDVNGVMAAIADAHRRAEITGKDIDLVIAHGTGTQQNDVVEATALTRAGCTDGFVISIKPMVGHTLGSSGLVSLVMAAACLRSDAVPANLHLARQIEAAAALTIPRQPVVHADLSFAQVNSFGFGGINAVAILEKLE